MSDVLDRLEAKLRAGEDITFEEGADLFENTTIGTAIISQNRLSRAQLIEMLRKRFTDEEALSASIRKMVAMLDAHGGTLQ